MSSSSLRYVMVCQHSSCLRQGAARVLLAFHVADLPDNMEATHSLKDILEAQKHYTFSKSIQGCGEFWNYFLSLG